MPSLLADLLRLFPELRALRECGYVVGGAIRDLLRGEQPADIDIAARDPLPCARSLGRKVIRLGRDHLSAYRVPGGRHVYDFAELLDGDIRLDLARRDFTINAMAVDLRSGELLDPHAGRADLAQRIVRMVREENFDDDPLRLLKAVRMAVTLRFDIDDGTLRAIRWRAATIARVSPDRVSYELSVIFGAARLRQAVRLLCETALDLPLFGRELDAAAFHADDVPAAAAFAALVGEPEAFGQRWRWSDALRRDVVALQRLLSKQADLGIALYDAGERVARQFPALLRALGRDDRVPMPDFTIRPLLSGDEIATVTGLTPGPRLGAVKRSLLEAQLRGEITAPGQAEEFVRRAIASD